MKTINIPITGVHTINIKQMLPLICHEYYNVITYLLQIKNSKTTAVMTSIKVTPLTIPARVPSKIKHMCDY